MRVLERGWLSSNNVVLTGTQGTALVDSGYQSHAAQTTALLQTALEGRPLDRLINTHLHSDHCGGNAALQQVYGSLQTLIPPGHAQQVHDWDAQALGYAEAGQDCPRFRCDGVLQPGSSIDLGAQRWDVYAAPGHDVHAVLLFEPQTATLLSGDALWERGFGVVFQELAGSAAFADVAQTLDLIERLQARVVVPGHGAPFTDVASALAVARRRLDAFVAQPQRHRQYAAKVLIKFRLLAVHQAERTELLAWLLATPLALQQVRQIFPDMSPALALDALLFELAHSGAVRLEGTMVCNT